jgi:hypothetical protein
VLQLIGASVDSETETRGLSGVREFSRGVVLAICVGNAIACGSVKSSVDPPIDGSGSSPGNPADAAVPSDTAVPSDAAPPDTTLPVTRFDIGYVNEFVIVPLDTTQIHSFLLVVNTGNVPLDLSTATVVTFSDDSNGVDWQFSKRTTAAFSLEPTRAAGSLGPNARPLIVDASVVTERIDDNVLDFQMDFLGTPASGVVANAQAVVRIGGIEAVLPFKITTLSAGESPKFNTAKRVHSQ